MAKAKNPLMSQEAHGALGGIEYRHNQYGAVIGRRSITPHKRTPAQLEARSILTLAQHAWTLLSDADRAAWQSLATHPQTGRNLYVGCCCRAQRFYTFVFPELPPLDIDASISNIRSTIGFVSTGGMVIQWNSTDIPPLNAIISAQGTWSRRTNPQHSRFPYQCRASTLDQTAQIYVPPRSPIVHVRIQLCDPASWMVRQTYYARLTPIWI